MKNNEERVFNPLVFLASLGAGGIAVMPFVFFQYTVDHGEGLVSRSALWSTPLAELGIMVLLLEVVMILFSLLHLFLSVFFGIKLYRWIKSGGHREILQDPLRNSVLLAPFISLAMTMNVFIGPIRYFITFMQDNFQAMFLPAFIFWAFLFLILMFLEIKLLGISFRKGFDINKITFGWLLHPFALGMVTVVGTGIAAMSKNAQIADLAAFMSLISGSMGAFLLIVKMIVLFQKHFSDKELPQKHFLPSFLIVIPNITLYAIAAFRMGHYLHSHHGFQVDYYYYLVVGIAFAFEIWYMIFGLSLLANYFRNNHFKEFYLTQWGFICPLVAFGVLGSFAYKIVLNSPILYWIIVLSIFITVALYIELLIKHVNCCKNRQKSLSCEL